MKIQFENGTVVEVDDHATDADIDEIHSQVVGSSKSKAMQGLEAIEPSVQSTTEEKPRALDYLSAPIETAGSIILGSAAQGLANIPAAVMDVTGIGDPNEFLKETSKWIPKPTSKLGEELTHKAGQIIDPLNAVMPNLQMMHALSSSGPLPNPLRKSVDPKLDAAKAEFEAKQAEANSPANTFAARKAGFTFNTQTRRLERGSEYIDPLTNQIIDQRQGVQGQTTPRVDERFKEPIQIPEERRLSHQAGEPLITFPDGTTMTRAEWEQRGRPEPKKELTTENEFYNLLKEEEQKLTQDVDTSEVRNPYLQGDRTVNTEVDSISGRPIFPEDAIVSEKPIISEQTGKEIAGAFVKGIDGYYLNPKYISELWFKLKDSTKEKLGLRSAEDLQDFVEMHERQHWSDYKETGKILHDGESVDAAERRINNWVKEQRDPLTADDSVGPAQLPDNFKEPYDGAPRFTPENTKTPAQLRAFKENLERTLESVNSKIAELELPGKDSGVADVAKLDAYRKGLEEQISRLQDTISEGRKRGISFEPKSSKSTEAGPGGKQGGGVNFGFSEKVVDTVKKLLDKTPSLKDFAEHLGSTPDNPVVRQLYNKYYGKEVVDLTPEQTVISKIPGLKETISPELQPLPDMIERWKHETDLSSGPVARALRENLSSGGRMTAARTGNSFIDWNVENILGETRRAQVVIKKIQNEIKGEANKLTGSIFQQFRTKGESAKLFVQAMHDLLKSEGKSELPDIAPEAKALTEKIRTALDDLGLKIQAELKSQGVENFQWRPNYLAGTFFGPYRSLVKDSSGNIIGVIAGKTKAEATHALDYVKSNMPDVTFDLVSYDPKFDTGPGSLGARYGKASEVLELLRNQSESAKELQNHLGDFYTKVQEDYMGYKQHFKPKTGVFGSEGSRPWADALSNARDLLEAQLGVIDHGYHWLAEQKLAKDMKEILTNDEINLPESKRYINEYLDHAFGRTEDNVKMFDAAMGFTANVLGISPSAFKEMTSIMRNTALTGTLGVSGGFVLTQFVQVPQALAIGFSKAIGEGFHGSKSGSSMIGGMDLVNGINGKFENMTAEGRYFFKYFTDNGVMDPHLVEHTIHRKVITTTGMNPIQKAVWESVNGAFKGAELLSGVIGKVSIEKPEAWTRGTFAMTMAHFYKSAGMSLKEAVIKADKDTSVLFVDYSAQERAMAFQRMGEMGKLASTVSTFKLNNLNQWFTFSNKKMYGTLAALALTSWFTAGLFGMPGLDESEFGATWLKSKGFDIKTPREFMLTNLPSVATFGPLSKALTLFGGPDTSLHRKFAQDNIVPDDLVSFIYPLLSFYTNKVDKGIDWVKSGFAKQEGAVLAREIVPGNFKYAVDYFGLTNEKGLTIDPNQIHNINPAHYDRTKNEWKLAAALGIPSQREFKAKQMSQLDKISQQAWKLSTKSKVESTISAFTDGNKEKFTKLYTEAIKYNPDAAKQISDHIQGNAISASVPLEDMLAIQFAKRARTEHGAKGLQQFRKMQENK